VRWAALEKEQDNRDIPDRATGSGDLFPGAQEVWKGEPPETQGADAKNLPAAES
jgi:hypothetical protein